MNKKEKQKNKKRIILITTISIVLFSTISLLIGRSNTKIETMLQDSISLIEYYVIKKPISFIGDIFNEYSSLKDVYEENAILKEKLDNYANVKSENKVLTDDLNKLKEITGMDSLRTEYQVKFAYVQTRPMDGWNQQVTINIGSMGDVKEGMAVITSQGMIGVVTSVSELSATVSLLTNEKMVNSIPVQIHMEEQTVYGLLDYYDVSEERYEITLLDNLESFTEGALVTTSGLDGGNMPAGLSIGKVTAKGMKEDGITTKLYVEPAAQFKDINYVAVVLSKAGTHE